MFKHDADMRHASRVVVHAARGAWRVARALFRAPCVTRHALWVMGNAPCTSRHAVRLIWHATRKIRHAGCGA
eukprot:389312-Lingulodinium_polyedra.AAC.1